MENVLARKFDFISLLRFTFPTVCMMVFFSLYTIIDGMFISRYIGEAALAATNIVYPLINIVLGIAIMLATGGGALVAKNMGEGEMAAAKRRFTLLVAAAAVIGVIIAVFSTAYMEELVYLLGATPLLIADCYDYAFIMLAFAPMIILKLLFDYFFVTAGRPKYSLYSGIVGGITNIGLDYLLIVVYDFGIEGAAWATVIAYTVPALIGLAYFFQSAHSLHFVKPVWETKVLFTACGNGYSEMVTQLSLAVTTYLFNWMMLRYLGEAGVAAITIVLYAEFLLTAAYLGFSGGAAPVVSYNFGAKNRRELRRLMRFGYRFIGAASLLSFLLAEVFSAALVGAFVGRETEVYEITLHGFRIFSISFLLNGINIFTSGMFTALSNGRVSAIISFLRSFLFIVLLMALLPLLWGADGIWLVIPAAEAAALGVVIYFISAYKIFQGYR